MPSLDYTLSFHIGWMARVEAHASQKAQGRTGVSTHSQSEAGASKREAFDQSDEAEEFQAVGMRCRECLLALVKELTQDSELAQGEDLPKAGDFPAWNEQIANTIAPGASAEHVRGYLKTTAERACRLVNWLTHANNAARTDADLALSATSHVVNNYAASVLKRRIGAPEQCGRCNSYRSTIDWRAGYWVERAIRSALRGLRCRKVASHERIRNRQAC